VSESQSRIRRAVQRGILRPMGRGMRIAATVIGAASLARIVQYRWPRGRVEDWTTQGDARLRANEARDGKTYFRRGDRSVRDLDGIVLHQMGFTRGDDPDRYTGVQAHFIVTPNGRIAQLHPISRYLFASSALNKGTVGVEFAGNFQSDKGRWHNPSQMGAQEGPTSAQIRAGRYLVGYIRREFAASGGQLKAVWGHRQGTGLRRANCPGPQIWHGIVPWANQRYGLQCVADDTVGDGNPIPESWRAWDDDDSALA